MRVNRISLEKRTPVSLFPTKRRECLLTTILATQGGGGISPTFGAALWILDYVMQTLVMGTKVISLSQKYNLESKNFAKNFNACRLFISTKVPLETVSQFFTTT
jgi:hypothetical protein